MLFTIVYTHIYTLKQKTQSSFSVENGYKSCRIFSIQFHSRLLAKKCAQAQMWMNEWRKEHCPNGGHFPLSTNSTNAGGNSTQVKRHATCLSVQIVLCAQTQLEKTTAAAAGASGGGGGGGGGGGEWNGKKN